MFIAYSVYITSYELLEITNISFSCRNYTKLKLTHKKYKEKRERKKEREFFNF